MPGLWVGSHKSRTGGESHLPHPVSHSSLDAAQDTVAFLGCKWSLPAYVELIIVPGTPRSLCAGMRYPVITQPVFMFGIAPSQL